MVVFIVNIAKTYITFREGFVVGAAGVTLVTLVALRTSRRALSPALPKPT